MDLVITRLDTGEEIYFQRNQVHFPDRLVEMSYHTRLRVCMFPVPGYYQFTILVDGEWIAQRRLRVYLKQEES